MTETKKCSFCGTPIFAYVRQYMRPVMAPMTRAGELYNEAQNITGMAYVRIPARYCPICGQKLEGSKNDK